MIKLIANAVAKLALSSVSTWINKLILDEKNSLTFNDGKFLKGLIGERSVELLEVFAYNGIEGLFPVLHNEASKTENDLDDLKVDAIESAVRATLAVAFGKEDNQ